MSGNFTADNSPQQSPESPRSPDTLESITAFSRFEFEPGKGNEGTKILMIEFEYDDNDRDPSGTWQVSWAGKSHVLPADERTLENNRRLYFLLPPGATIPPKVLLSYQAPPASDATVKQPQRLTVNPLPAIFPPELGVTATTSGKKGVLHTIWAKKRLQALEQEIRREEKFNVEGIALSMALAEREWIENNFGIPQRGPTLDLSAASRYPTGPVSPSTPRTPGGRKLSDKLRGLSIGTSDRDLRRQDSVNTPSHESHPLSPESPDVAFSSFRSFRSSPVSMSSSTGRKKVVSHSPPDHIKFQQSSSQMPSMDAMSRQRTKESTDGLFAKALSPRSPGVPKSPFSNSPPLSKIKGDE